MAKTLLFNNMFVFTPTEKGTYAVALADDLKPTIKSVVIPSEYAGKPVTEIASSAFANCSNLAVIDIPDTVEKIGESAFFASGIESVVIPDSVTEIGSYASQTAKILPKSVWETA